MSSSKQVRANRRNSRRSTGPKSPKGKAIVARNPIRHGLLSGLRVLPELESQEEWETHLAVTIENLQPVGYMEELLAERIAFHWWRLRRAVRFERDSVAAVLEDAEEGSGMFVDQWIDDKRVRVSRLAQAKDKVEMATHWHSVLGNLGDLPSDKIVGTGEDLLERVCDAANVTYGELLPRLYQLMGWETDGGKKYAGEWVVEDLRKLIRGLSQHSRASPSRLRRTMTTRARLAIERAEQEHADLVRKLRRYRQQHVFLDSYAQESLMRHEGQIERAVHKSMHELERIQARRQGAMVAAPVAIDVDVNHSDNGKYIAAAPSHGPKRKRSQ